MQRNGLDIGNGDSLEFMGKFCYLGNNNNNNNNNEYD